MIDPSKLTIPKINNKNKETWIFENKPLLRAFLNAKADETYEHDLYQHLDKDMKPKKEDYTKKDEKGVDVEDVKEFKKALAAWRHHENLAQAYILQLLEDRLLQHLFMGTGVLDADEESPPVHEGWKKVMEHLGLGSESTCQCYRQQIATLAQKPGETLLLYHRSLSELMLALKTAGYLAEDKYKLLRDEYYGKECYDKFVMGSEDPSGLEEIFDRRGIKNDLSKVGVYLEEQDRLITQSCMQRQHITDLALSAAGKPQSQNQHRKPPANQKRLSTEPKPRPAGPAILSPSTRSTWP
ncbi:hypothetical protein HDU76_011269 [Blyttiomyces sp. JEL0837]|nr:hypothetical protein HDU76_011269 [Blyttiomyces sp. JEL0837]